MFARYTRTMTGTDSLVTNVLVVAADPLARGGIAALLDSSTAIAIVGSVSPEESEAMAAATGPDVVLADVGHEANVAAFINGLSPDAPVLALVANAEQASEVRSICIPGILPRDADVDTLSAALAAVATGLHVTDGRFLRDGGRGRKNAGAEPLTPREHEVLGLVAEGLPNKTIALELGLSEHTVKFHLTAVMSKLEAQSRAEAVAEGFRRGLIAL